MGAYASHQKQKVVLMILYLVKYSKNLHTGGSAGT
jgi:hypothetical protein